MNRHNDIARTLDQFLGDGPRAVSDHALQRALDALERTPQRHRRLPWRFLDVTPIARLASAAVVAALAFGGLLYVVAPRMGAGIPAATPAPTPTPTPVPSAPECLVEPVFRQLLAGDCTYQTNILGLPLFIDGTGHFLYQPIETGVILSAVDRTSNGDEIEILRLAGIPSSPCADAMSETPGPTPATSAAYIAWLQRSPLASLPVTDVTIGGLSGRRLDVSTGFLQSANPAPGGVRCDLLWLSAAEWGAIHINQESEQGTRINVLDSTVGLIVIVERYLGGLPAEGLALADQLSGIRFSP